MANVPPLPRGTTEFTLRSKRDGQLTLVAEALESADVVGFIEITYDGGVIVTVRDYDADVVRREFASRAIVAREMQVG
jgi:hypothetical protein